MLDGSSSSSLICTVWMLKSVKQFAGASLIVVFEIIVAKEGPLLIVVVKFKPSGSIESGRLCSKVWPNYT